MGITILPSGAIKVAVEEGPLGLTRTSIPHPQNQYIGILSEKSLYLVAPIVDYRLAFPYTYNF